MKTIDELKGLLIATFPKAHIYLFGSRANNRASSYSAYDIAIESDTPIGEQLTIIKEQIDRSSIPWKIDLVDLSKTPYLKEIVHKEGVRWH